MVVEELEMRWWWWWNRNYNPLNLAGSDRVKDSTGSKVRTTDDRTKSQCVCVCVFVCVRACVRVCLCVSGCVW